MNVKEATDYLIYCAKNGNIVGVEAALRDGAPSHSLHAALEEALRFEHFELCDYLIAQKATLKLSKELLALVVQKNSLALAQYLKNKNIDILAYQEKLFIDFVYLGNQPALEYLIDLGANYHIQNEYPLRIACTTQNLSLVRYFVEKGADIKSSNYSVLEIACVGQDSAILTYLLTQEPCAWSWLLAHKNNLVLSPAIKHYIENRESVMREAAQLQQSIPCCEKNETKKDKI